MQGGVAAMLELTRGYVTSDRCPPVTLAFAFASDEEVVGDTGLQAVLDVDRLPADACVVGEPSGSADTPPVTGIDQGSL